MMNQEMSNITCLTREALIDLINLDISHLYSAAIQYNNHAAMIKGAVWMSYAQDIKNHAHDDFYQAQELSERITLLGGCPTVQVAPVKTAESSLEMVEQDMSIQLESIDRLKKRIEQLMDAEEFGFVEIYQEILKHEQGHLLTTEAALGDKLPAEEVETIKIRMARQARQKNYMA